MKHDGDTRISRDIKRVLGPNRDTSLIHLGLEASSEWSGGKDIGEALKSQSLVHGCHGPAESHPARQRKRYPTYEGKRWAQYDGKAMKTVKVPLPNLGSGTNSV